MDVDALRFGWLIAIGLSIIPALASWIIHAVTTPWRGSEMGRHLFWYMGAIAVTMTLTGVAVMLALLDVDRPRWFEWLRLASFTGVFLTLTWRLWLQVRSLRHARQAASPKPPSRRPA